MTDVQERAAGSSSGTAIDGPAAPATAASSRHATRTAEQDGIGKHPELVPLVVRVGITGHRPNRLEEADLNLLHARVREVLQRIRQVTDDIARRASDAYAPGPPTLRLVSSLAEGSDRIAAAEAQALGYELQCPLPFYREVYEEDFKTAESLAEFRGLLDEATAVFELNGAREEAHIRRASYEAAGQIVLSQSDAIICIWDGVQSHGEGGTGSIAATALEEGVPTIWINSRAPHDITLLVNTGGVAPERLPLEQIGDQLLPLFLPPATTTAHGQQSGSEAFERYRAETFPRWTLFGWVWPFFVDLVANLRVHLPRVRTTKPAQASASWQRDWNPGSGLPEGVTQQLDGVIKPHYMWASALARYYVNVHRSSFLVVVLLAVLAVFLALVGYASYWYEHHSPLETVRGFTVLGVLVAILLLWRLGQARRWHERWIDYRLLTELLRQVRYLALLGRVPASARIPAHSAAVDPMNTWVGWHTRAITRQLGLVHARITDDYLRACRSLLRDGLIGSQISYHANSARQMERLDRRLRMLGLTTFVLTFIAVLVTFINHWRWLTLAEAVLPALGGAFGAIRSQGEIERLASRSEAMHDYLEQIRDQLDAQGTTPPLIVVAQVAENATDALTAEVTDWRIVFQTKPLELPG